MRLPTQKQDGDRQERQAKYHNGVRHGAMLGRPEVQGQCEEQLAPVAPPVALSVGFLRPNPLSEQTYSREYDESGARYDQPMGQLHHLKLRAH